MENKEIIYNKNGEVENPDTYIIRNDVIQGIQKINNMIDELLAQRKIIKKQYYYHYYSYDSNGNIEHKIPGIKGYTYIHKLIVNAIKEDNKIYDALATVQIIRAKTLLNDNYSGPYINYFSSGTIDFLHLII